jgi:predicted amidohydrolase
VTEPRVRFQITHFTPTAATHENLRACLAAIDEASRLRPAVLVLPPFANYGAPIESPTQAYSVSTRVPGPFVEEIQERVRIRRVWVVFGVLERGDNSPDVFDTRLVITPSGHLAGLRRKQIVFDTGASWRVLDPEETSRIDGHGIDFVIGGDRVDPPSASVGPQSPPTCVSVYIRSSGE